MSFDHNGGPIMIEPHPDDRMIYIQWHIRDFLQGVQGMKAEQIGIYALVLCLIYDNMGALRDDDKFIAGHCRIDVRTYVKIRQTLLDAGKVFEADGYLYNNRASAEIAKFCAMTQRKREAALQREAKKREERPDVADTNPQDLRTACAQRAQGVHKPRAKYAGDAPATHASRAVDNSKACRENDGKPNNINGRHTTAVVSAVVGGGTTAVAQPSIYKEIEEEEERKSHQHPLSESSTARVKRSAEDARILSERLLVVAGPAMANAAGAAGLLNLSPIMAWIEAGADPETDIVPAVQRVAAAAQAKGMQSIRSWEYFNVAVAEAKARREKGLPKVEIAKPGPKPGEQGYVNAKGWVRI